MKLQPLALFPLPSHILPGGKLPLRLFEPRHLQMLKESFINDQGFGIVMEESTTSGQSGRILPVGTRVKVTDFYSLNDGLLGVTVLGLERFCIHEMETDEMGLRRAKVEMLPNWPSTHSDFNDKLLVNRLREVFEQYPELDELYPDKRFEDAAWLCQRWLEILPMPIYEKQMLIAKQNSEAARKFLHRLISQ
ncbi:ATP-dependent protease [Aeromonas veronii]|uniref:LON peptidase substrate-binding domain-containing protein n=1 Tax=Aeromonas TaxID=642 RepID=UPI00191CECC3|nr:MULTISPECIES: LON peptidase substrate-binding domain-containing protein [Aeromonas]KAJ8739130.1 LON peptidase substrate-binding domain-containing protein [Aeromonas veronii]MBL0641974.1 LON peptidase substrate-binding domain-containing protein [Aeromonas veronii]MBW3781174.1 ATP-dependent protease [Aeromonas veronii]MDA3316363.1 LON peptidase substrate-binding domain-containing protein [Aeromonas sp. PI_26]QXA99911.1 LON peptidase substrate-binding domain-containing protein [Aeromonas sp. F